MATGDVIRWESHRGRQLEFDEIEAGTATIYLKNRHGKYDPTNGASPYNGKLLPLKQSVITGHKPTTPGVKVRQFTGYVDRWDFERRGPRHGVAVLQLVDGFEPLARASISPSMTSGSYFAEQRVDDRMRAALQDVGWPAIKTNLFTGNVEMQPVLYEPGTSALEVIRDAAEAEFPGVGMVFMTKNGTVRFTGRCHRFNQLDPTWRLGDAAARVLNPTLIPIRNVEWTYEREHIYNKVLILPAGVQPRNEYVRTASASIAKHGPRTLEITDLLIQKGTTTGNTALKECTDVFAKFYVDNYKSPYIRPHSLELSASFMEAGAASYLDPLWSFILNVELGDLIELNTVHPGGGGLAALRYYVEGIQNYVDPPLRWRQVIDLSPKGRFDQQAYLGC